MAWRHILMLSPSVLCHDIRTFTFGTLTIHATLASANIAPPCARHSLVSVGFSLIFLLEISLFILNELPDILGYLREIVNADPRDPILFQFILSPQS